MNNECHLIPSLYLYFPYYLKTIFLKSIHMNQDPEEDHTLNLMVILK